ncbi:MAG: hypothetical protein IPH77_17540 [Ignavibacteria bacterium]|nr:hypothetical protein [Ignavibacteria bacterium]
MLADKGRMDAYHKAITEHVKKDDVVIDLGYRHRHSFLFRFKEFLKNYAVEHGAIIESTKRWLLILIFHALSS